MKFYFVCEDTTEALERMKKFFTGKYFGQDMYFLPSSAGIEGLREKEDACVLGALSTPVSEKLSYVESNFDYAVGPESALEQTLLIFDEIVQGFAKTKEILDDIESGELKVSFQGYEFGANHEYDRHRFRLQRNGRDVGTLEILSLEEFGLQLSSYFFYGTACGFKTSPHIFSHIKQTLQMAMLRDDKEYTQKYWDGKGIKFPHTYTDVSREDLFDESIMETFEKDALVYVL